MRSRGDAEQGEAAESVGLDEAAPAREEVRELNWQMNWRH
jgi:hypothetical protein